MNRNRIFKLSCLLLVVACGCGRMTVDEDNGLEFASKYREVSISTLAATDTLYSFYEDYPVRIAEKDGLLFVILHGSDSLAGVVDTRSGKLDYIARRGSGPDDFQELDFLPNSHLSGDSTIAMYDCNLYKSLTYDCSTRACKTVQFPFGPVQSLNSFGSGFVGTSIMERDGIFSFYDSNGVVLQSVGYPFELSEATLGKMGAMNMLLTPYLYVNQAKGRILAPMYFMDVVYAYDASGRLLNTCSLSCDTFDADSALGRFMDAKSIVRYSGGYATGNGCYLMRSYCTPDMQTGRYTPVSRQIVLFDWDGNPVEAYTFADSEISGFCVSDTGKIIAIVHDVEDSGGEVFHLVTFG